MKFITSSIAVFLVSMIAGIRAEDDAAVTRQNATQEVGTFVFDYPKIVDIKKPNWFIYPIGETVKLKWHVEPGELGVPGNITIQWRRGRWPNVTAFETIVENFSGTSYDWVLNGSLFPGTYVLKLSSPQRDPWITDGISAAISVYRNGTFVWSPEDDENSTPSNVSIGGYTIGLISLAALMMIF